MGTKLLLDRCYVEPKTPRLSSLISRSCRSNLVRNVSFGINTHGSSSSCGGWWLRRAERRLLLVASAGMQPPVELTEENVEKVLVDARMELSQLFDTSVGITGQAELAELDGPFVKIRLKGKFWHKRSTVLARLDNYLKLRIPDILEVDIEDADQLDDSPQNF